MKKIVLGLMCLVSFGFTSNITFDDVDWIYNVGVKECQDVKKVGYGTDVVKMVNGQGYAINGQFKDIKMTEFTNGKLNFWMFPDKLSCEKFKKNLVNKK